MWQCKAFAMSKQVQKMQKNANQSNCVVGGEHEPATAVQSESCSNSLRVLHTTRHLLYHLPVQQMSGSVIVGSPSAKQGAECTEFFQQSVLLCSSTLQWDLLYFRLGAATVQSSWLCTGLSHLVADHHHKQQQAASALTLAAAAPDPLLIQPKISLSYSFVWICLTWGCLLELSIGLIWKKPTIKLHRHKIIPNFIWP